MTNCILNVMLLGLLIDGAVTAQQPRYRIASFREDITIPLNHRCMGVLPTKSKEIVDPLDANGFVITGIDKPVVILGLDWCEVRNGAYDQWRDAIARAAGTDRNRVILSCLHQHDAPVTDSGAQAYLDNVGLHGELYDTEFHNDCIARVAHAVRQALKESRPLTHIGIGQAKVQNVASSRRVVWPDGQVKYNRYSSSGRDPFHSTAPDGEIDPYLKTISFFDGDIPLVALHTYATHPMSHYGKGSVSADFVGIARRRLGMDTPGVRQIYLTGCGGDVTAGKYNDGAPATRAVLADSLFTGMRKAWQNAKQNRQPMTDIDFRNVQFDLPFHEDEEFRHKALLATLNNKDAKIEDRILAAMGLSSLDRITSGQKIDLPCLDLGPAQIVLLPGESFVGYQLMAQRIRPASFVMAIGFGECWPGYIPTQRAFDEKFGHDWRWAGPGSPAKIRAALEAVLTKTRD